MKTFVVLLLAILFYCSLTGVGFANDDALPIQVGQFDQQVHTAYTQKEGLPTNSIFRIVSDSQGKVYAKTAVGIAQLDGDRWQAVDNHVANKSAAQLFRQGDMTYPAIESQLGSPGEIRDAASHQGETAVAAENGLYLSDGNTWRLALPRHGHRRWAPWDVRAVAYDLEGKLWFACPQGVGVRLQKGNWKLFTGADGLPYNDFTCMAAGPKGIWFGTTNGAIRYYKGQWEFRQGGRWLVDNHVSDICVDKAGTAWFATPGGVSRIELQATSLAEKAAFYEDEIENIIAGRALDT